MKRFLRLIALLLAVSLFAAGCTGTARYRYEQPLNVIDDACRTWYEVFVPSFYDSNGDGTGDLNGLIAKLDYLNDGKGGGLGINGLWLMPIMPSPSYHKYDVTNYEDVDPSYGTLGDLEGLVSACHQRGIRLIIDYELNHTSSQHPWFLSATAALQQNPDHPAANPYLGYYNFVRGRPSIGSYAQVGTTDWYYEDQFGPTMPDLNLDNPALRTQIQEITRFWLDKGIDGFRLDAVLYYYGGSGSGDTGKNVAFVNWLTDYCRTIDPAVYLVGEVWSNATTIAEYYQSHATSFFAFPFAQATGIVATTLNGTGPDASAKSFCSATVTWQKMLKEYNKEAIDAPFIGNHDTARPAGFFSGDEQKTKMAGGLYLTMSGGPFLYYGEEIGMTGSRIDQDKRGPFLWSSMVKTGMTKGPPGMDPPVPLFPPLDVQEKDPASLYSYYRQAIRLRNENPEIGRGTVTLLDPFPDPEVCAVEKTWHGSRIILVINTSEKRMTVTFGPSANHYTGIRGYLSTTGAAVTLRGDSLSLPPMSIAVLK
ncbi:MAG: alpha-amylase family glycosyl hydrolase [Candidatus Cryosericum sp.]